MKIAVIGAMSEEISFLLHNMSNLKENKCDNHIFYHGFIESNEIIAVRCGIGKVAAGIAYALLLSQYPDIALSINVGVCGGRVGYAKIGEVIIPDAVSYADVDLTYFSDFQFGQMANCPPFFAPRTDSVALLADKLPSYRSGMILSGDCFYHKQEEVDAVVSRYFPAKKVLALDMETAALAQCAYVFKKDFIAIRAVSDLIGSTFQANDYNKNLNKACLASNAFLLAFLQNI